MDVQKKIPVTIVSGFLGAGKTTIISHLIDALLVKNVKVAYIKNEIGTEDVDGVLMRGKHITTRELLNGCICCTLTGPFYHALTELVETVHPDRIMIEGSGVADPSAIALLVSSHPLVFRDGVISIIDVVNFEGYKNLSETAKRQAQFTDLIVFNKVELTDRERKQAVVGYVRELNEIAPIVEAKLGNLSVDLAFGISTQDLDTLLQITKDHLHHSHLKDEDISSVNIQFEGIVLPEKLQEVLNGLPLNVIRVKGFVETADGTMIVNKVGKRSSVESTSLSRAVLSNCLVCIGFAVSELEEDLFSRFIKTVQGI
jgi:G3E family GTPase